MLHRQRVIAAVVSTLNESTPHRKTSCIVVVFTTTTIDPHYVKGPPHRNRGWNASYETSAAIQIPVASTATEDAQQFSCNPNLGVGSRKGH